MGRQRDGGEQRAWVLQPCPSYLLERVLRVGGGGRCRGVVRCGSCDASSEREGSRGRESAVVRGTSGHGCN